MKYIKLLQHKSKRIVSFVKKHKIITGIFLVVIAATIFFLRPKEPTPIETQTVSRDEIVQTLSITGSVDADNSVNLSFQIAGQLNWLGVKEGDAVNAYQAIASLDQKTALKTLQDDLLDYSLQRNSFDQTQANNQNRKPYQALNDDMKRILENNQYNLDKAIVSVEIQDLVRQKSILITPIAGIVTNMSVKHAGVNITTATNFTITNPDSLNFTMEIDEADIGKIKEGQAVDVVLDSYLNDSLNLIIDRIDFVSHKTSTGGDAFNVRAKIDQNNHSYKFRVGMNGNAQIILSKKENVITIPLSSIYNDNKVYIKTNKDFEEKKIELGEQNDTSVEVLSGLSIGDKVVLDPTQVPQKK